MVPELSRVAGHVCRRVYKTASSSGFSLFHGILRRWNRPHDSSRTADLGGGTGKVTEPAATGRRRVPPVMKFLRRQRIRDSWVVRDSMFSRNKLNNRLTYTKVPNIAEIERELSGTENGELWENTENAWDCR